MKTIALIAILSIGCSLQNQNKIELPAKIFSYNMRQPSFLYINERKIDFYVSKITKKDQTILGWLNKQDLLLMIESSQDYLGNYFYDNLYTIDTTNSIVDTIYRGDISKGEIITGAYVTPNDSIILIHLGQNPLNTNAVNNWYNPSFQILIMDFINKKVIDTIKNNPFQKGYYRQNSSFIFSPDGKNFVYSISDERSLHNIENEKDNLLSKNDNGIYIYNLETKLPMKIIDEGIEPIWSPNGSIIAYSNNNEVWFYNPITKEKTMFFKPKANLSLVKILWTPDGENIFIMTREKTSLHPSGLLTRRLINVKNKSEIVDGNLDKLGLFFYWK